jgi:hypothetical protein
MENLNLKKRIFKFRDQYAKDLHFDKHKNEEFPTKPETSNHYEDLANRDIKEAGFLTISYAKNYSSSKNNFGLLTFHRSTPTTLNVVSLYDNNLLHSYYVPKFTFIPEFLIFSYFFDKYRKKIFLAKTENDTNKVSLIFDLKDKFPSGTFLRWTEDFFFRYKTIANNTKSKKEFLKFFINSRKETIHLIDEYVELNKIILSIIDNFVKNGLILNSVKIDSNSFVEIEKLIIYTDEQLYKFLIFEPENQFFSITQIFTLAYMLWIYSMIYKDQPKSIYLRSINNSIDIKFYFDLYSELFKELNQAVSLEEIFN